jgi:hypothetical protein
VSPQRTKHTGPGFVGRSILVVALCTLGCPKRDAESVDQLQPLLDAADRAWDARGRDGLDPVDDALQRAYSAVPDSPEVSWRVARVKIARALATDDESKRVATLGQAREVAWSCVLSDPGVRARAVEVGLRNALRAVSPERERCVLWAGYAWVRWMADFGPAAATVDLARLDPITRHLERRQGGGEEPTREGTAPSSGRRGRTPRRPATIWTDEEQVLITWTSGLLLAIRPTWAGQDRVRAETLLATVAQSDPRNLLPLADLARFAPAETRPEWAARLRGQRPDTPEERGYGPRVLGESPP